jgi:exosome complex component RRP4
VRRLKSHFLALPSGVDVVLGLNGFLWISKHVQDAEQAGEDGFDAAAVYSNKNDVRRVPFFLILLLLAATARPGRAHQWSAGADRADRSQVIDDATRAAIARVANLVRALAAHSVPLSDVILLEAYEWAVEQAPDVKDLLREDVAEALVAAVTYR